MGRLRSLLLPIGLALVVASGYGGYWTIYLRGSVFTDDARVEGDVIPCATQKLGRLIELPFSSGMRVKKGDIIARFDDTDARAELHQAKAEVIVAMAQIEQAKAKLSKIQAEVAAEINAKEAMLSVSQAELERILSGAREQEIKIARSKVEAARRRAKLRAGELTRVERLVAGKIESRQELERAETLACEADEDLRSAELYLHLLETGAREEDRKIARANLSAAEAELRKSSSRQKELDLVLAEEKVAVAELELAKARLTKAESNLRETLISAPMDGVIARVHGAEGQVMQPSQTIVTLVNTASLWIEANIEEDDIGRIKQGYRAVIKLDAYPNREFEGEVEGILGATLSNFSLFSATSSSGNYIKVTQRVPVRVRLLENNLPPLYPGLNAEVRIYCMENH